MKTLRHLATQLAAIQEKARALGLFVGDRELLSCPACGLRENVLFSGELITEHEEAPDTDTGLRFEELTSCCFRCPACGGRLGASSVRTRTGQEIEPVVVKRICYELARRACSQCHQSFQSQAPGVLPKAMLGNQLLSEIVGAHYWQGVPRSGLARRFGLHLGTVIEALHRLGNIFQPALKQLQEEYRRALVRHADETGWRTDGRNGYRWLFCTDRVCVCTGRRARRAS